MAAISASNQPGEKANSLSARTAVSPDIPGSIAILFPQLSDLLARQSFVVTIIPFADCVGDFDIGVCADRLLVLGLSAVQPGHPLLAPDLQELQGPLRSMTRGDIAVYMNSVNTGILLETSDR